MSARNGPWGASYQSGWWTWLRHELAYAPGRDLTTVRIVLTVALVTVISLALQVPELAISAYMVIFVTKENRVLTKLAGVLVILGITLGIAGSLLLYGATFDYPALRIPILAMTLFAGMYLARVFVIGPLGFAIGFVVALTQSAADGVPTPELLVRALLWLWVALVYPIALTVLVNQVLLPAEPWADFTRALLSRLDVAVAALERASEEGIIGGRRDSTLLEISTRGSGPLLKLLRFAEGMDARIKRRHPSFVAAVAASEQIVSAAAALELGDRQKLSDGDRDRARALGVRIVALKAAMPSRVPVAVNIPPNGGPAASPELRNLDLATDALADSLAQDEPATADGIHAAKEKKSLFVPDAFSDPAHARFALKVTLAAMSCYVIYSGLDWRGIHTAFITCTIIALESNGATRRKGTLRIVGCCVGGLLGFLSIVYLVPQMESVVSLILLVSSVTALAGWVAAGSERTAYAGLQIALAFYLCIFQGFAPDTDFDKIRDRLMGIILGLVVSSVIFRYLWPERSGERLRTVLSRLLRSLGQLVLLPTSSTLRAVAASEAESLRGAITRDLDESLRLKELALLENEVPNRASHLPAEKLNEIVGHAQALYLIGRTLTTHAGLDAWAKLAPAERDLEAALRGNMAQQLLRAGDSIAAGDPSLQSDSETGQARPPAIFGPESETGRASLVRRLEEQTRQLSASLEVGNRVPRSMPVAPMNQSEHATA